MSRFGRIDSLKSRIALGLVIALASVPAFAAAPADDTFHLPPLMNCFFQVKPFTDSGAHATVYPSDQNYIFLPGTYANREGVFIYSDQGTSFVAISDAYASKPVAFDVSSSHGSLSVIYQPGSGKQRPQVWLRSPNGTHNTGVTQVFKMADDSERRLPLENELDAMVRGMSSTWDTREDALVKAVEDGKYLWAEVDLDHYKDSLSRCMKLMNDYSETSSLRSTMKGEIEALNTRSSRSGVVHDELVGPSGFMTTPQY